VEAILLLSQFFDSRRICNPWLAALSADTALWQASGNAATSSSLSVATRDLLASRLFTFGGDIFW